MNNPTEITITDNEFQSFIIHSVRYALGRMTYVVGEVCDVVTKYRKQLSNSTLSILIRDIKTHPKNGGNYGMQCDEAKWLSLLDELETELEERKNEH